jgi:CheY-like chemotaxis protein
MEAIGRLAGGIAHDFNNLLTVIAGRSQLLLASRLGSAADTRRDLELVQSAAALTRQLLAFSRKQVLQPRVLDLNEVVGNLESMLRRLIGEHITLHLRLADGLWRTHADPSQIEQVVINLVVNARDAMPDGGWVTIETANVELDEGYARQHVDARPGPHVALTVSDSGVGMDPATLGRVFEPFFTTKAPGTGTGLGLSTVYGIVKQSGGSIGVYREPGRGATFKVYLPQAEADPAAAEPERREPAGVPGAETILLLEDDAGVADLAQEILAGHGYTVLAARSPSEGLRLAATHPGPIHLLVTDVVMPEMSGREFAERLCARRRETKVLYISGYVPGFAEPPRRPWLCPPCARVPRVPCLIDAASVEGDARVGARAARCRNRRGSVVSARGWRRRQAVRWPGSPAEEHPEADRNEPDGGDHPEVPGRRPGPHAVPDQDGEERRGAEGGGGRQEDAELVHRGIRGEEHGGELGLVAELGQEHGHEDDGVGSHPLTLPATPRP